MAYPNNNPYGLRRPIPVAEPQPNEYQKGFRRFLGGVSPSIDRVQGTVQGVLGLEQKAQANFEQARLAEEAVAQDMSLRPRIGGIQNIRTDQGFGALAEDVGDFAASTLGENVPLMGSMALTGAGAGFAGRAALGARATAPAAYAGAAVPYEGVSVAESSRDIHDDPDATGTLQEQSLGVLGTGTAKTALGLAPIGAGARVLRTPGLSPLKRGVAAGAAAGLSEAGTEVGEEFIGKRGHKLFNPEVTLGAEGDLWDYGNAAAGGVILGGPTGFAAGVLAPKGLIQPAENAIQSGIEEGKTPEQALDGFLAADGDLLSEQEIEGLRGELPNFQALEPRSGLARRVAKMEADEALDLAYSQNFGIPRTQYQAQKAKAQESYRNQLREVARSLLTGKVTQDDPAVADVVKADPVGVREAVLALREEADGNVGSGLDPAELASTGNLNVEDPERSTFEYNFKGMPWRRDSLEDMDKVSKRLTLESMESQRQRGYHGTKGEQRKAADRWLSENSPYRPVTLREALTREAEGVTDKEANIRSRFETEFLPNLNERDTAEYLANPEEFVVDYLDNNFVLEKTPTPRQTDPNAVETIQPEKLRDNKLPETRRARAQKGVGGAISREEVSRAMFEGLGMVPSEAKALWRQYTSASDVERAELVGEYAGMDEVVNRAYQPEVRELRERFNQQQDIARANKGVVRSDTNEARGKRIPVDELDPKTGKVKRQLLDVMQAAIESQSQVPYDPKNPMDSTMKQIVEGVSSVLLARTRNIKLTNSGIPKETIVYTKNGKQYAWGDVEDWFKTDKGRKWFEEEHNTAEEDTRGQQDLREREVEVGEGLEYEMGKTQPLLKYGEEPQREGGLAKEPGPYYKDKDAKKSEDVYHVYRNEYGNERDKTFEDRQRREGDPVKVPRAALAPREAASAEAQEEYAQGVRESRKPKPEKSLADKALAPEKPKRKVPQKEFGFKEQKTSENEGPSKLQEVKAEQRKRREKDAERTGNYEGIDYSEIPESSQESVDKIIEADDPKRRDRHQNIANAMSKRLGLQQIRILDAKEAISLIVASGDGHRITHKNGFTTRLGGKPVIYVNPSLPEDAAVEVLGHEIGHVTLNETWGAAPKRVKRAVERGFAEWVNQFSDANSLYDVMSKRTPQRILENALWSHDLDVKLRDLPEKQQKYTLAFEEWFADNVSKWMVTDAKPVGLVQQFFKYVSDVLSDLWSGLVRQVNAPEESVQEYMDAVFSTTEVAPLFAEPESTFAFSSTPDGVSPDEAAAAVQTMGPGWAASHDVTVISKAMKKGLSGVEMNVLARAAQMPFVKRQLSSFYQSDTSAMEALDNNDATRMTVLLYKAWRAGEVKLSNKQQSVLAKFSERMAEVMGVVTTGASAESVMREVASGAVFLPEREGFVRSRINKTVLQQSRDYVERLSDPVLRLANKVGGSAEMRVRGTKNAAITELWKQLYLSPDSTGGREGFFAARQRQRGKFDTRMHMIFEGKDEEFGARVVQILNKQVPMSEGNAKEQRAVKQTQKLLREMRDYAVEAGVELGDKGDDYFPRVYDVDHMAKHGDEFVDMLVGKYEHELQKYNGDLKDTPIEEVARRIQRAIARQGEETAATEDISREMDEDPLGWPSANALKERSLGWIKDQDVAPFLSSDLGLTLSTYITQMVKRAEYNRRFGVGTGRKLVTAYIREAEKFGATAEDIGVAENAVKAALGTLGADINPTAHKLQGAVMVMENWLLLGLATLTSLVDPIGIAVRGDLETAWVALKAGLGEVAAAAKGDETQLAKMAGLLGVNELHNTVEALGYEYGGYFVTGRARRLNELLFKMNMLTSWTRLTRTMALAGAKQFVEKHGDFKYNDNSERFMLELGLRKGDVKLDGDGGLIVLSDAERKKLKSTKWAEESGAEIKEKYALYKKKNEKFKEKYGHLENTHQHGRYIALFNTHVGSFTDFSKGDRGVLSADKRVMQAREEFKRDERIRMALNRWVDEAILRPDAAQRPIWASDPHYLLLFHLKAFTYSFHERILRRVGHEIMEGNYKPAVMLLGYLPMMLLAEAMRNGLQGDDLDDSVGKDAGMFETSHYLAQRAGLYGLGQFAFDLKQGSQYGDTPFSVLGGPTLEHMLSIGEAAVTEKDTDDERALTRSLPLHNVWQKWFDER